MKNLRKAIFHLQQSIKENDNNKELLKALGILNSQRFLTKNSEAMQFLLEKWNNCIEVSMDENTITYFDKEYVNNILTKTKSIESLKNNDNWLFCFDLENKYCWIDYTQIWRVLYSKFSLNYSEVKQLSGCMLNEHTKYKGFTTKFGY